MHYFNFMPPGTACFHHPNFKKIHITSIAHFDSCKQGLEHVVEFMRRVLQRFMLC